VVLGVAVWRTGTGPVVAGLRALDGWTLLLAALLAALTTVASAWRWKLVARGLGVGVDLGTAVASYYRSQFLNAVLPGGVVGDVHRGLRHGRAAGATGLGVRTVFWERLSGQVVQAALVLLGLVLLPSPVRSRLPEIAAVVLCGCLVVWVMWRFIAVAEARRPGLLRTVHSDVSRGLLARDTWPGVVVASSVAVLGYVATYLVAARAVGVTTSLAQLLPLILIVLLAAGLPFNLAGWGPREGVAAWAFGAAGLGAAQGMATAVAFGALMFAGTLPGAVVLALGARASAAAQKPPTAVTPGPVGTGSAHG